MEMVERILLLAPNGYSLLVVGVPQSGELCKLYPPTPPLRRPGHPVFLGSQPCVPAAWLAERLLLAGGIESNPGLDIWMSPERVVPLLIRWKRRLASLEKLGCRTPPQLHAGGVGRQQHLAATARIRKGWMKFRELLQFLTSRAPPLEMKGRVYASCVRSSMTYGSETRPYLVDVGLKFERAEMKDRRTNEELRRLVGVEPITTFIRMVD